MEYSKIDLDRTPAIALGYKDNFLIEENQVASQHGAVSREDGTKPSLPRNCERNEICHGH
jgi:hypothetical protein